DMIFKPHQLVSLLSHDMTLKPGDVICVGTNVGVGSMKLPSNDVAVTIDGIGTLENVFKN
ncbi:MAG: 2-hydroxyhepta-2,4-diene-1,7-dioate isomerase, partial [Rhodospirillales bacterium]|nr:2-hydroxyhepta-2,4-diene-1,7-dioate isomerase [Rhodospirillales bacterium]